MLQKETLFERDDFLKVVSVNAILSFKIRFFPFPSFLSVTSLEHSHESKPKIKLLQNFIDFHYK